jgi:glycerophosphoryl diester phosphodiesterase
LKDDAVLRAELQQCASSITSFKRNDVAIGHRGACLQFPEHTLESYRAAIRQGAGIVECDVTFTKDRQLVCRHAQCDLHTTTDVLRRPDLAAKCTRPFNGTVGALGPICCTTDFTLVEVQSLCAKMDAANAGATTVPAYLDATSRFRTDLFSYECPKVPTHKESIQLIRAGGAKFTPELKSPEVPMPYEGNYTQQDYAQQMINEYIELGIPPEDVWPQSFDERDVYYWVRNTTYGGQAVALDPNDNSAGNPAAINAYLDRLVAGGVQIVAPPTRRLVEADVFGGKLGMKPSYYAGAAKARGLDIITWTLERSANLRLGGGYYYQSDAEFVANANSAGIADNNGDVFVMLDTLYREVGILGVFSDWPATVNFYANCVERCSPIYNVYNAATNTLVGSLKKGQTFKCPPREINIEVVLPCGPPSPGPVSIKLSNSADNVVLASRNEKNAPYFLFGDNGLGDVLSGSINRGKYWISATVNGKTSDPFTFKIGSSCPA